MQTIDFVVETKIAQTSRVKQLGAMLRFPA